MEQKPRRPVLTPPPAKNPPTLTPPSGPRSISRGARSPRSRVAFLIAFAAVAVIAIGVVVILPRLIPQPSGAPGTGLEAPDRETSRGFTEAAEKTGLQQSARVKAESLLRMVLQSQARLENNGVRIWGEEKLVTRYADALAAVSAANSFLDAGQFDLAATKYNETLSLFDQLERSRPDRLRNALQNGTAALEQFDDKTARAQFEIALSLDPGNSPATRGLRRARNLGQVSERIRQGGAFEATGDLANAKKAYQEASELDGESQLARDRLRRIDEMIQARDYDRALSAASAALERKDYAASQDSLDRAARLRPNAPEVGLISRKLQEATQTAALERIRRDAAEHERGERWEQALKSYEQALRIDKNTTFALAGKTRSEKYLKLNQQIDSYIANPDRLQSPDPLAHARELLGASNGIPDVGASLRKKLERLRVLVDDFSTPRPVILRSDEMTHVTVYQVGRFGPFSEHRMMLRPGRYTAVGSRTGFRDVRVQFLVPASGNETTVIIRCEERI